MQNMTPPPLTPKRAPGVTSSMPANMAGGVPAELQKSKMTGAPHGQVNYQNNVSFVQNTIQSAISVPSNIPSQTPSHHAMDFLSATQPNTFVLNPNVAISSATKNPAPVHVASTAGLNTTEDRQLGSIDSANNQPGTLMSNTQNAAPSHQKGMPWQSHPGPLHPAPSTTKNDSSSKFITDLVARAVSSAEPKDATSQKTIPIVRDSPFVNVEVVTNVAPARKTTVSNTPLPSSNGPASVQNELPANYVERSDSTPLASGNTATTIAIEIAQKSEEPMVEKNDTLKKFTTSGDVELAYPRIVDGKLPTGISMEARAAMLKADAEDELQCFIATTNNAVRLRQDGKKILFEVSLQEFPPNTDLDLLKRYYHGKAYRRACVEVANKEYNFKQHLPFIVEHRGSSKFLFCELTRKTLPLDCHVVENHVNSKKYLRLKEEAEMRMAERKRVLERKRKFAVGERNAKVQAREKDAAEETMEILGYESAEDSDFDVNVEETQEGVVEGEDDDGDSDADVIDPLQQDIMKEKLVPPGISPVVGKTGPERKSKTRAADMRHSVSDIPGYESQEDSDFDPTEADDGDVEMGSDADKIVDPIMKEAAAAAKTARRKVVKKEVLHRRSKERAIGEVAKEASHLENEDSSDDDDFNPTEKQIMKAEQDVGSESEDGDEVIEMMVTPAKKNQDEGKTNRKNNETPTPKQEINLKEGEYYIYRTVQKTPPPRPVNGHLAEVREKLRKKRDKKKALRKAMKKVAYERKLIAQAKQELIQEQERLDETGFWTRGKFDVDDELVRAKAFGKDATDAEWTTRQVPPLAGMKRKRTPQPAPRTAKRSRQERMRRLMPGSSSSSRPETRN